MLFPKHKDNFGFIWGNSTAEFDEAVKYELTLEQQQAPTTCRAYREKARLWLGAMAAHGIEPRRAIL
jgi:hypothetical protein